MVENFNRTLQAMIAKSVDVFGTDWDEYLHHLFVYRTKPHDSKPAKRAYNRHSPPKTFREGDCVMVYMPVERTGKNRKLSRPYFGPYQVLEVHPNSLTMRPVDHPNEQSIRVNQDQVTVQKN